MNFVSVAALTLKLQPIAASFMGRVDGATLIKEIIAQRTDIAGHEQVVLKVISLFYFI